MREKRLKILMILLEPPLPFGNAASRWFHVLLEGLRKRNHHVDVMVASGVESDIAKAKKVFAKDPHFWIFPFSTKRTLFNKLNTFLFPHRYMFNEDFKKQLQRLNPDNYDIVHIEQTWAGWIGFPWKEKTLINVHHLQMIDLEFVKTKSFKEWLLYKSWFLAERRILTQYPFVRICSPRLLDYVKQWGPKKLIETVPVSLDFTLYPYIDSTQRKASSPIVTVIGNMTWYPSVSAAERLLNDLWPRIKEQVPEARVRVVGWSARSALKDHLEKPDIEILENVPDIQPYFAEASVMVYAPQRGSGMKIKILESLAFGIPVITTSEGAEGLPAEDMVHMGLCDDDAGLIERTVRVLKDLSLQESLRTHGRQLVTTYCGEDRTVNMIASMYEKIRSAKVSTQKSI